MEKTMNTERLGCGYVVFCVVRWLARTVLGVDPWDYDAVLWGVVQDGEEEMAGIPSPSGTCGGCVSQESAQRGS